MTKAIARPMSNPVLSRLLLASVLWLFGAAMVLASDAVERFVGSYSGTAELVSADGKVETRDMGVKIERTKKGFIVTWSSTTIKSDGRRKEKEYSVEFEPTDRDDIFAAAMQRNMFGHAEQLDPMKGDPYVWGRIVGDTLTVYSLYINENGGYEMQQYDRTLTDGGMNLEFLRVHDGFPQKSVVAFLARQ
ncbi:hypothetical protein [Shimia biformata]|uniref:hypothetical protein n=1 Tax=Shimia biformata TaxID=1294299 RepID=UPI001EF3197C|nr:hypothetical protein [Shimia biformata]